MHKQLIKSGVNISHKEMHDIVYNYMDSLPSSISDVDVGGMNAKQIDNLKTVIIGKNGIDNKIKRFETMKKEVGRLRDEMSKLYPEPLYAPELDLISDAVRYALSVGVPKSLIKRKFKNLNLSKSKNVWPRNLTRPPPGVY